MSICIKCWNTIRPHFLKKHSIWSGMYQALIVTWPLIYYFYVTNFFLDIVRCLLCKVRELNSVFQRRALFTKCCAFSPVECLKVATSVRGSWLDVLPSFNVSWRKSLPPKLCVRFLLFKHCAMDKDQPEFCQMWHTFIRCIHNWIMTFSVLFFLRKVQVGFLDEIDMHVGVCVTSISTS